MNRDCKPICISCLIQLILPTLLYMVHQHQIKLVLNVEAVVVNVQKKAFVLGCLIDGLVFYR